MSNFFQTIYKYFISLKFSDHPQSWFLVPVYDFYAPELVFIKRQFADFIPLELPPRFLNYCENHDKRD